MQRAVLSEIRFCLADCNRKTSFSVRFLFSTTVGSNHNISECERFGHPLLYLALTQERSEFGWVSLHSVYYSPNL